MYLLYLDESGSTGSGYFVVGGLAVHEQDAWPLAQRAELLSNRISNYGRGAEFHASPMRRGKGEWHTVSPRERDLITSEIAEILTTDLPETKRPPVLFATALHKASARQHNPYERTYEEFFARCNGYLGRRASAGDRHRCVAISDKSDHLEAALQRRMQEWMVSGASTGARIGRMSSYAEVPLFVDSRASRLVQLADFVAFWIFRAYTNQDHEILDRLLPAFDQEDSGPIHGLVHLVDDYSTCSCAACLSRR